jgi:8-oxo-dGTP diphosphatase
MSTKERFMLPCAVSLLLIKDGKVLLLRRHNTGWQDGKYGVPAGHIDGDEALTEALIREADEEIGIKISPDDATFVHMTHIKSNKEYLYVYFAVKRWEGEPYNKEPNKCDRLYWAPLHKLPRNIVPVIRDAIENYRQGALYSENGWR